MKLHGLQPQICEKGNHEIFYQHGQEYLTALKKSWIWSKIIWWFDGNFIFWLVQVWSCPKFFEGCYFYIFLIPESKTLTVITLILCINLPSNHCGSSFRWLNFVLTSLFLMYDVISSNFSLLYKRLLILSKVIYQEVLSTI